VNKQWVAEIQKQGQPALGLCGGDARLVEVRKMVLGSNGQRKNLGYVGRPRKVNTAVLEMALDAGLIPVVASLALNGSTQYFNVNADDLAAAIATALRADRLIYLTESGGVWDAERKLLPLVKRNEIPSLIRKGVVRDGMIPKLRSCARTLGQGVSEIGILSSSAPEVLLRALSASGPIGTRIVSGQ